MVQGFARWCRGLQAAEKRQEAAQSLMRARGWWCEQREGCEGCWRLNLRTNPRVGRKLGRKEAPDWSTLQPASSPRRGAERVPRGLKTSLKKALEEKKVEAKTETFGLLSSIGLMVELEGQVGRF